MSIWELIKKFTVKLIELAIDIPSIPIKWDRIILNIILAPTAKNPVIIGPFVFLKEYSPRSMMSLTPELVKPMAYPISAALVIATEFALNSPLAYAIVTISLEHMQVTIVIGSIMQIIVLMALRIVSISFSKLPSVV